MKNRRGFTLVELLAVIVVLAIIMIIAVPAVLDSMEAAEFNSFKTFGQNAIRKAMELRQSEELSGKQYWVTGYYQASGSHNYDRQNCYPLEVLKLETGGKYKGSVWYDSKNKDYKLYLTDGKYYTYYYSYRLNKADSDTPCRVGINLSEINDATLAGAKKDLSSASATTAKKYKIRLKTNYEVDTSRIQNSYKIAEADWFDGDGTDAIPGMISLCGRKYSHK